MAGQKVFSAASLAEYRRFLDELRQVSPVPGPEAEAGTALAGNGPVEGVILGEGASMVVATPTEIIVFNPYWDRTRKNRWNLGAVTGVEYQMGTLRGAVAVRSVEAPDTPLSWSSCHAAPDGIGLMSWQASKAQHGLAAIRQLVSAVNVGRLLIGVEAGPTFVCDECGGLASTLSAVAAGFESATAAFGRDVERVVWFASDEQLADEPIRPASLQEALGVSYEEASRILQALLSYGLLEGSGTTLNLASPLCAECYVRRRQVQPVAGGGRELIPRSVKHEVWRRDQGKCVACGSKERLEFDHVIPVSMGGSNTARNLQLLCESCNRSKGGTLG